MISGPGAGAVGSFRQHFSRAPAWHRVSWVALKLPTDPPGHARSPTFMGMGVAPRHDARLLRFAVSMHFLPSDRAGAMRGSIRCVLKRGAGSLGQRPSQARSLGSGESIERIIKEHSSDNRPY
jgi:hypothetical protein